jgi:ribosomal protein S18 acetylase RimI-like enzyme
VTLVKHTTIHLSTPDIVPLRLSDVPHLHFRRHARVDESDVRQILETNPGSSFWIPDTGEFIVVGNWRNRYELHAIHALSAFHNESRLIRHAAEHAQRAGVVALLSVDADELRKPAFYVNNGFEIVDTIATFELPKTRLEPKPARTDLSFRAVDADDLDLLSELESLDHAAFPWFWWNVAAEFLVYAHLPGVAIYGGYLEDELVSYIGLTTYPGWGHLDRIATRPDLQGTGIGAASLEFAIRELVAYGANRVALSTQGENTTAQKLYARRGFLRTPVHDYTVYGNVLDPDRFHVDSNES